VDTPEGAMCLASQLNYIIEIVLELKAKLAKIKAEVKKIKKQLSITYLSLINEIRHSEKSNLSISAPFRHKYPLQNRKIKNSFLVQEVKTQEGVENNTQCDPTCAGSGEIRM